MLGLENQRKYQMCLMKEVIIHKKITQAEIELNP